VAAEDDPQGYYRVLGLAPNATQAQILHAYREWAKTYHPDASGNADARGFHQIKEAYDILSDEIRRARYDTPGHNRTSSEAQPRPQSSDAQRAPKEQSRPRPEAVHCSSCGAISAQPRYCIFSRVISVLIYTRMSHIHGAFCPQCAARMSLRESVISWLCGWWSIMGIFETVAALWKNVLMGEKPRNVNARLLISQAEYFLGVANHTLARSCIQQAKKFAEGEDAEVLFTLQRAIREDNAKRIRDRWTIYRHPELFGHIFPVVLVAGALSYYGASTSVKSSLLPPHTLAGSPTSRPKDIRHVASPFVAIWKLDPSGKYASDGFLNQFATVEVVGPSGDPKFLIALLPNGQKGTLAASDLGTGDGATARIRWCQESTEPYPLNGEVFRKLRSGPNRIVVINNGRNEAVAKFRDATGSVVASVFVGNNSQASVENFPDGSYHLEYATGLGWSRRCGIFGQDLHTQRFPTADTFASWKTVESAQGGSQLVTHFGTMTYTITPVPHGNIRAEPIDPDAFVRD
jgi:hypothetical protein